MFISDDANLCYFNPAAMEDMEEEFELVGKLLGLAVYNNATLDIPLPLVSILVYLGILLADSFYSSRLCSRNCKMKK